MHKKDEIISQLRDYARAFLRYNQHIQYAMSGRFMRSSVVPYLIVLLMLPSMTWADADGITADSIAGLYKTTFENGDIDGDRFTSENSLEIVKHTSNSVYFHTELSFFNFHSCELYGIADIEGNSLIYKGVNEDHQACTFRMDVGNGGISFSDEGGACRVDTCGSRGGHDGTRFALTQRTKITDVEKVKSSKEYFEALHEYAARKKDGRNGPPDTSHTTEEYQWDGIVDWDINRANKGDIAAYAALGRLYEQGFGVQKDPAKAFAYYLHAAEKGYAPAQFYLGQIYADGAADIPKDEAQAVGWFKKAAAQGHPEAEFRIGDAYRDGHGLPQDIFQAYVWYARAATSGISAAFNKRDALAHRLTAAQISSAQAEARKWRPKTEIASDFSPGEMLDINSITGVYREKRKQLGSANDSAGSFEEILEVVKYSSNKAYFRARLQSFEGKTCEAWGLAEANRKNSLTYHRTVSNDDGNCIIEIRVDRGTIRLSASGGICIKEGNECGHILSGSFSLNHRQEISYISKVLASKQYSEALKEYTSSTGINLPEN